MVEHANRPRGKVRSKIGRAEHTRRARRNPRRLGGISARRDDDGSRYARFPIEARATGIGPGPRCGSLSSGEPTDVVVLTEMPFCECGDVRKRSVDSPRGSRRWRPRRRWRSALSRRSRRSLASRTVEKIQGQRLKQASRGAARRVSRRERQDYLREEPDGWKRPGRSRGGRPVLRWRPPRECRADSSSVPSCWSVKRHGSRGIAAAAQDAPSATGGNQRWPMAACLAAIMAGALRSLDESPLLEQRRLSRPQAA